MFKLSNYTVLLVLLLSFSCIYQISAQKEGNDYSKIFKIDKDGKIIVSEGYKVLTFKENAIIYDVSNWEILKKSGTLQVIKKGKKGGGKGMNNCPECKPSVCNLNDGKICVIRGTSCTCESQGGDDCDCEADEFCVNGRCTPNNGGTTSLRKISLFE